MPLFAHPKLIAELCETIAEYAKTIEGGIQGVAGLEARGKRERRRGSDHYLNRRLYRDDCVI